MSLNVLYTVLLSSQPFSVWRWLIPFFIFQIFVFYLYTIGERYQAVAEPRQKGSRTTQAVAEPLRQLEESFRHSIKINIILTFTAHLICLLTF